MSVSTAPKIESNDLTMADVFKDFYSVPDFQREYVWEEENVEKLLDDIYQEFYGDDGRLLDSSHEYFVGSIVVCKHEDGTFHLIDGQQRMTTSYLAMCAIRDVLKKKSADPPDTLCKQIADSSMDHRTGDDIFRYRIDLQYDDSKGVLLEIAKGDRDLNEIEDSTNSVRHLLEAYKAARTFLDDHFNNDPARIKQFLAAFNHRVKLIRIITPNLADALKVFETINERGVGLSAMDLLKNLLFMKTSSQQYPKLKERWKNLIDTLDRADEKPLRFLRYFIMSHFTTDFNRPLREDQIYEWFTKHADECGINSDPMGFLDTLVARAKAYSDFALGRDKDGRQNRYLNNISKLSGAARQHFILLLAGQHLPKEQFNELCRWIENLFFCYIITRETTRTFERNFAKWSPALRKVKDEKGLNTFIEENIKPDLASSSKEFDFAFENLDQSRIQQYRMRYILAKLTQYVDEEAWGRQTEISEYFDRDIHIEHILPQANKSKARDQFDKPNEFRSYVEKLGNLTLLEKIINSSISHGTYEEKKPVYGESKFLLTKSLAVKPQVGKDTKLNRAVEDLLQFSAWDSQGIEQRQKMLGKLARKVWQIPDRAEKE